jgi:hypothetical protein
LEELPKSLEKKEEVKAWISNFVGGMEATDWKKCLMCGEDWTKLKRCHFYWDQGWNIIDICQDCGEGTTSLENIALAYPIPGVIISYKYLPGYKAGGFANRHKKVGVATYSDFYTYLIRSQSISPYLIVTRPKDEYTFFADNTMSAWSKIQKSLVDVA